MDKITVKKVELVETVEKNRNEHRALFLKAQEKYREKVIATLDERLEQARNGGKINIYFNLPEPVDYTDSYDTALEMLAWEIGDEVELSKDDFRKLVLNKWAWAAEFATNSLAYLSE